MGVHARQQRLHERDSAVDVAAGERDPREAGPALRLLPHLPDVRERLHRTLEHHLGAVQVAGGDVDLARDQTRVRHQQVEIGVSGDLGRAPCASTGTLEVTGFQRDQRQVPQRVALQQPESQLLRTGERALEVLLRGVEVADRERQDAEVVEGRVDGLLVTEAQGQFERLQAQPL
jgi:hypothetical protein